MKDAEEWIAKQKWISEMKIATLEKTIKNIGRPNMQTIHISANDFGMGMALRGGDYIDISEDQEAHVMIKEYLIKSLEKEKLHLKTITNE